MTGTKGYIAALIFGLTIGWLGQQFWLAGSANDEFRRDNHLLSRNEQRIKLLQQSGERSSSPLSEASGSNLDLTKFQNLVDSGQLDLAAQLVIDGEARYGHKLSFSEIIATKFLESAQYEKAFTFLYEQRLFVEPEIEADLLPLIYELVETVDLTLAEQAHVSELVSLYRLLISLHADYPPYYLRLTYWLVESGEMDQAGQSLAGAMNDIHYQDHVASLQKRIAAFDSPQEPFVIPLIKKGKHFIAQLVIEGVKPFDLMIDTGASMTVIKTSVANAEFPDMLNNAEPLMLNTANGKVIGQKTSLSYIELGDVQLENVDIGIMPLPDFQYDGLLGMNILSRFEFFIDQENNQLILR